MEQEGVGCVQADAHEVVPAAPEPEELHVGHVGEPGERVPVGGVEGGERPCQAAPREALADDGIFCDVDGVVEEDEIVVGDGGEGDRCQEEDSPGHDGAESSPPGARSLRPWGHASSSAGG